jgi:predicted alpha/beta superfamily hydrolase
VDARDRERPAVSSQQGDGRGKRQDVVKPHKGRLPRNTERTPAGALPRGAGPRLGSLQLHQGFRSRHLDNQRTLAVYLPPGYPARGQRYPVFYLHDGQNLFDAATAAFGVAWDADARAEQLIRAGRIPPLILVGIYNTPERIPEYTVHYDPRERVGGRGDLYSRFVFEEVKPFIDAEYRTRPEREFTAVAGSSLGGLIALAMARSHHEHFSRCGVLSPSLWWCQEQMLRDLEPEEESAWIRTMRFWVDMGTREGRGKQALHPGIQRTRRLIDRFDAAGLLPGRDYYYLEVAGGLHNEASWGARFDKVLLYFFGEMAGS